MGERGQSQDNYDEAGDPIGLQSNTSEGTDPSDVIFDPRDESVPNPRWAEGPVT
jgi:hypothetical protein